LNAHIVDHGRSRLGLTARWLALAAAAAVAVGCGGAATPAGSTAPTATEPAATRPATSALQTVTVYFPDARALHILPERRSVPADGEALRLALEELAAGPRSAELLPALPAGTAVIDARLVDGTARIDLDAAFERGYPSGGAAGEIAVLAPLVYTATAVDGAQRALITVEGRAPALAGSQFDFSEPLARSDFPDDLLGR
jgi:spore germination protein GerM